MLLDDGEELEGHAAGLFYAALPLLHGGLAGVEVAGKDRGRPTHRMEQRRDEWGTRLRAKGPGLKPIDSMGLIQWAEAHCSLRKAKTGVYPQPVKPRSKQAVCGGTKVPPFQNADLCSGFLKLCGTARQEASKWRIVALSSAPTLSIAEAEEWIASKTSLLNLRFVVMAFSLEF